MKTHVYPWLTAMMMTMLWVASPSTTYAHIMTYTVNLSGPNEAPPNTSPGTGSGTVVFDADLVTLTVDVTFSGLNGNVTAAHIHAPTAVAGSGTAGVATQTPSFTLFPSGGTSGTYNRTFDMTLASSYNAAFITANGGTVATALNAFVAAADSGKAYLNIHTSAFAAGEIRGFLTAVPEPSSLMLAGLVAGGVALRYRLKKSSRQKLA